MPIHAIIADAGERKRIISDLIASTVAADIATKPTPLESTKSPVSYSSLIILILLGCYVSLYLLLLIVDFSYLSIGNLWSFGLLTGNLFANLQHSSMGDFNESIFNESHYLINYNEQPWNIQVIYYVISFMTAFNIAYSTNLFYLYLDYNARNSPTIRKWKIQPNKMFDTPQILSIQIKCFLLEIMQGLTIGPILWYVYKIYGLNYDFRVESLPEFGEVWKQILFLMLWDDTVTHWVHRLLHTPFFYAKIHKKHHEFTYPIGPTFLMTHALENIMMNLPSVAGGTLIILISGNPMHYLTYLVWVIIRVNEAVVRHCGYYFPWSLTPYLFPGAPFHDYHHSHNKGAYGTFFCVWDRLTGTDRDFYEHWRKRA